MLARNRRLFSVTTGAFLVLALVFLTMADDSSTDIPIYCEDTVPAGTSISGYIELFTPPVSVSGVITGGASLPGSPQSSFNSNRAYFLFPTTEAMSGKVVVVSAHDSKGKTGMKAVLVI